MDSNSGISKVPMIVKSITTLIEITIGVIELFEKVESINAKQLITDKERNAIKKANRNLIPTSALLITVSASLFKTTTSPFPNKKVKENKPIYLTK